MGILQVVLIVAGFLCSLVAGFLFAFALVVMPGIKRLSDREFIRAFQVMDGIIQNNQPLFLLVWVGSIVALVAATVLGFAHIDGTERLLLIVATVAYLFGVQLSTFTINVPLNNKLQALNVEAMSEAEHAAARHDFEPRWNTWNVSRTFFASLASTALMVLLLRL